MITIERHPNLDNWLEVRHFGKLLDQFTSLVEAHRFASEQAREKRTRVLNLDRGTKNNDSHWYYDSCIDYLFYYWLYYKMNITIGKSFKVKQKNCGNYVLVLKKHKKKWCAPRRGLWLSSAGFTYWHGPCSSRRANLIAREPSVYAGSRGPWD